MTTSPSDSHSTGRANFRNARLLIIEDNPDHVLIITSALRQCLPEVKPIFVTTEKEALSYLSRCQQEEWDMPKLILLDLYFPDRQNGWRVLEAVKALPSTQGKVPVVLLSNSSSRSDISEAYDRGCSSYLVKPSNLADWIDYFQMIRSYWWETVTLPKTKISFC